MKTSLEDAIDRLDYLEAHYNLEGSFNLGEVRGFLGALKSVSVPTVMVTDADGIILENARLDGFQKIDDAADLYVVSGNGVIAFANRHKGPK